MCIYILYVKQKLNNDVLQDMERDIADKDGNVRDLALKGKDLQDFCKGKNLI